MNSLDWIEIIILLQGNFTSVLASGALPPKPPSGDRWPSDPPAVGTPNPPGGISPPHTRPPRVEGCTIFLGYTSGWNKDL